MENAKNKIDVDEAIMFTLYDKFGCELDPQAS